MIIIHPFLSPFSAFILTSIPYSPTNHNPIEDNIPLYRHINALVLPIIYQQRMSILASWRLSELKTAICT
jgi:hypothetical protein